MKWSCCLGTKFSCFFEISFLGVVLIDEVSNNILLETSYEDIWHWLLNLPIAIQSARRWRELFISVNKSYRSFPIASESTNLNLWWLSIILVLSCCSSEWWFMCIFDSWSSYRRDLETIWSSLQFSFPKFWCLAVFQFEIFPLNVGFQLLEDFFGLNQWKGLLSWIPNFRVSLRLVSWV